jgi:hypothetical protein
LHRATRPQPPLNATPGRQNGAACRYLLRNSTCRMRSKSARCSGRQGRAEPRTSRSTRPSAAQAKLSRLPPARPIHRRLRRPPCAAVRLA